MDHSCLRCGACCTISSQCDTAQLAHGLPVLTPEGWLDSSDAGEPPLPQSA